MAVRLTQTQIETAELRAKLQALEEKAAEAPRSPGASLASLAVVLGGGRKPRTPTPTPAVVAARPPGASPEEVCAREAKIKELEATVATLRSGLAAHGSQPQCPQGQAGPCTAVPRLEEGVDDNLGRKEAGDPQAPSRPRPWPASGRPTEVPQLRRLVGGSPDGGGVSEDGDTAWRARRWDEASLITASSSSCDVPSQGGGFKACSPRPHHVANRDDAEYSPSSSSRSVSPPLSPVAALATDWDRDVCSAREVEGSEDGVPFVTAGMMRREKTFEEQSPRLLEQLFSTGSHEAQLMSRVRQTRMQRYMTRQKSMSLPPVFE